MNLKQCQFLSNFLKIIQNGKNFLILIFELAWLFMLQNLSDILV